MSIENPSPNEGARAPKPAKAPSRDLPSGGLDGRFARVEALEAARHGPDIWAAGIAAPELWRYLPYGPFDNERAFLAWLETRQTLADPLYFAILDRQSGRALGVATLMEIRPEDGVIEVGHIVFSPRLQRTPVASEGIYLLMRHAFENLGNRRFEWKCDNTNAASCAAARRFGFRFEGVFRQHKIVKGRNRDTAWFSILDGEWEGVKAGFEAWLAPDNFDADGRQRASLAFLRSAKTAEG